ncbi:MAG TPA: DinB family protein [Steroidobacteraceae bacterium]|nr:DinB family protein [Steroidobacteraceae bacterium]
MTPQIAKLLAEYNRWMNQRMYDSAATLSTLELLADKGAFFGSILGTLNHIAVADTIWLHRFARHPASFATLEGLAGFPCLASLRHSLGPDLATLRVYRERLDEVIERWASELTFAHLSIDLEYANMAGVTSGKSFAALVQHFFNHQTHHRGQVSTLLFQSGVDVGVTDLLALIPAMSDNAPELA